jgi:hypothetical protein
MRYINVCTVDDPFQAKFIKDNLANEGIECIVTNENFTAMMPHMNGMLGAGIQILVDKDDFERASQIVTNRNSREIQVCPNCGSSNINYGLGSRHRFKKLFALLIAFVIGTPVRHIKQTHFCKDCSTEF